MRKETVRRLGLLLFSVAAALLFYGLSTVSGRQEPRRPASSAAVRSDAQEYEQEDLEQKKVAISFDDDVIIGLSQEISYKEAVSMI